MPLLSRPRDVCEIGHVSGHVWCLLNHWGRHAPWWPSASRCPKQIHSELGPRRGPITAPCLQDSSFYTRATFRNQVNLNLINFSVSSNELARISLVEFGSKFIWLNWVVRVNRVKVELCIPGGSTPLVSSHLLPSDILVLATTVSK